ncbi:integrase arm-type DNA-binding domain-containing protein [Actimicrobium antarcticum]|uniref:Site-specific DNA-methyltransferase (adenine-specific) n=1 Tax=Actimicrobium antarcticum TaxID=1051899 RepID=A0ABP7SJW6_9BURK
MPKLAIPLTDIQPRTAKPKEKPYKPGDGGGLYLLVNPDGSKYWRMSCRFEGIERLLWFGKYPDVSLKDARNKRIAARDKMDNGIYQAQAKRLEKRQKAISAANTFEAVAREWDANKLVEVCDHIAPQVSTPDQRRALQRSSLYGQEAKPLPYRLAQMNLLLHGLEAPQIAYGNTPQRRVSEIGHSERVDVIFTNPPFGGEEEAGINANFPPDMQTAETALLFLQYIMRKLRVAGFGAERGGPIDTVWHYELPLPEGRKKYSKTAPLQFEEFAPMQAWWNAREESPQAWKIDFAAKRAAAIDAATPHWQRAEAEVMRLLGEIEVLVNEVQA